MKKTTVSKSSKHRATSKHTATSKHAAHEAHVAHEEHEAHLRHTAVAKPAAHKKAAKARKLALGDAVACCAAEALAASLRLAGARVDDDDVLALYERTAAGHDAGASIPATLEAAARSGLAGCQVASFAPADLASHLPTGLILGLELPGPHAVTVDARGRWWSWGQPFDPAAFPHAVIEEAWAVSWS